MVIWIATLIYIVSLVWFVPSDYSGGDYAQAWGFLSSCFKAMLITLPYMLFWIVYLAIVR